MLELDTGFDWSIDDSQELRLKLQVIGPDAGLRGAYQVAADGRAIASGQPVSASTCAISACSCVTAIG